MSFILLYLVFTLLYFIYYDTKMFIYSNIIKYIFCINSFHFIHIIRTIVQALNFIIIYNYNFHYVFLILGTLGQDPLLSKFLGKRDVVLKKYVWKKSSNKI